MPNFRTRKPPAGPKRIGRPPKPLTERVKPAYLETVLFEISEGKSVGEAVEAANEQHAASFKRHTVFGWVADDPAFGDRFVRATERRWMVVADELDRLAGQAPEDALDAQRIKLLVDTRKWILSKLRRHEYGDTPAQVTVDARQVHVHQLTGEASELVSRVLGMLGGPALLGGTVASPEQGQGAQEAVEAGDEPGEG